MNFKLDEEMFTCPRCSSDDISAYTIDCESISRVVECNSCGFEWRECFTFEYNERMDSDG